MEAAAAAVEAAGLAGASSRDMDPETRALYDRMKAKYAPQLEAGAGLGQALDGQTLEAQLAAADTTMAAERRAAAAGAKSRSVPQSNWDVKLCGHCSGTGKVTEDYNGRSLQNHCATCDGEGTVKRWIGKGPKPVAADDGGANGDTGYRRTARNVDALETLLASGRLDAGGKRLSALRRAEAQRLKYMDELHHMRKLLLGDTGQSDEAKDRRHARTDYANALEAHLRKLDAEVERLTSAREARRVARGDTPAPGANGHAVEDAATGSDDALESLD